MNIYAEITEPYRASLAMVKDAIGEIFGPSASIESDDAELLRGPEPHHTAEAIIAALHRVAESQLVKNTAATEENTAATWALNQQLQALQMELRNLP